MTCWKWFDRMLKEAGAKIIDKIKGKVEIVTHPYIREQSSYGRFSTDRREARKEIQSDGLMKKELVERLKTVVEAFSFFQGKYSKCIH